VNVDAAQVHPARAHHPQTWTDIFFAVVTRPYETFLYLKDADDFPPDNTALSGAVAVVFMGSLIETASQIALSDAGVMVAQLLFGLMGSYFGWLGLSSLVHLASIATEGVKANFRSVYLVIAWTSVPFFFAAPISCFKFILGPLYLLAAWIPPLWAFFLLILAIKAILNIRSLRLAAIIMLAPPILALVYTFWLVFIVLAVGSGLINDAVP